MHDSIMFGWRGNRVGIAVGKGSVRVVGVSGTATQYHLSTLIVEQVRTTTILS